MSGSEKMSFRIIYAMFYLVLCVQRIKELLFQSVLKVHFKTVLPKRKRDVRLCTSQCIRSTFPEVFVAKSNLDRRFNPLR